MVNRRNFLKATIAVAGATIAACGDDPEPNSDTGIDSGTDTGNGDTGDTGVDVPTDTPSDADTGPEFLDGAAVFALGVASGDPRPNSVILWTRCVDPEADTVSFDLRLQVGLDPDFGELVSFDGEDSLPLTADAEHDFCVKVRLTELEPGTDYYYRFIQGDRASTVGHTKTAPADDADVAARFAFVSCQDFNGHYYTSYKRLMQEELDFFVHLGDYVYETTGDPSFQDSTPGRVVNFTDLEGAIELEEGGEVFYSARSLDNYRELYRTYRGDPELQRVHAAIPMVAVWDDHEFADDCHGATTTMTAGREDELDLERRTNANRAWFDYMPVDYLETNFQYDDSVTPPDDIQIYRDIRYGKNLHLVMTDLRLFRADHVVAEDAFPGRVAMTEEALVAQEGDLPGWADAYVDIETYAEGSYVGALTATEHSAEEAAGLVAVRYINGVVEGLIEDGNTTWELIEDDTLPRGLAFLTLGKASKFSSIGSRYLAVQQPYDAYARMRFAESDGASENMMGDAQQEWFLNAMTTSDAVWKVWGNEFTLTPRRVDTQEFAVPPAFQNIFSLSVEDWDGCPNKRDELLDALADTDNVVAVTGDIHAFFAGVPSVSTDLDRGIVEFVGAGIASTPYERLLLRTAASDPALLAAGATALALLVQDLLAEPGVNPTLGFSNIKQNGFATVAVSAESLDVTYFQTDRQNVSIDVPEDEVAGVFTEERFQVLAGERALYREIDGNFVRWNPETSSWG